MTATLYTAYHKASHILENDSVRPIHVGAAAADHVLPMQRDDEGDHISEKNPYFCELTAQYWAWKNDTTSSHVGLQHYRRFLQINPDTNKDTLSIHGTRLPGFFYGFIDDIGQSTDQIEHCVAEYDIVLPIPFDVSNIGFRSTREQYAKSEHHIGSDLNLVEEIIASDHPDYLSACKAEFDGTVFYQTNTFLLRKDIFDDYSSWLFDILFKAEKRIDASARDQQAARVFGYLSERLFNVYLRRYREMHPETRVLEVPLCFIENTDPLEPIPEFFEFDGVEQTMQLAVATDANFAPYCHVLVASVIRNRKRNYGINIILLEGGLSAQDVDHFRRYAKRYPLVNVQVLSMAHAFSNVYLRPPFSKETFYRLILPDLLPNHKKILYLDADMTAVEDIIELWETELGNAPIAAATDFINVGFQESGTPSDIATGTIPAKTYAANVLGLDGIENQYFQAGTLLMNLDELRKRNMSRILVDDIQKNKYWFLDQDVLNKHLARDAVKIGQEWNVYHVADDLMTALNAEHRAELNEGRKAPKIAHFAGIAKPWHNTVHPLSWVFWEHARHTPYYEILIIQLKRKHLIQLFPHPKDLLGRASFNQPKMTLYRSLRMVYQRLPKRVRGYLPHNLVRKLVDMLR